MRGPLIVTAELAPKDFAWLDGLRRQHYPPQRNRVPAHLTLFRSLPPSAAGEVERLLKRETAAAPPRATAAGLMQLDRGVAVRILSPDLERLRAELAEGLHGLLSAQDGPGWAPHVTIQNKVPAPEARSLRRSLDSCFEPRPLGIAGLGLHLYVAGPWETLRTFRFRPR